MQEGGDRGKGPNKTGTQPRKKTTRLPMKRHRTKTVAGASTARKAGPKKTARGKTTRSGDKR